VVGLHRANQRQWIGVKIPRLFHLPALSLHPWRWRQYVSPKSCHLPMKLHSIKTKNITIIHLYCFSRCAISLKLSFLRHGLM
jgi:hypothetical protein